MPPKKDTSASTGESSGLSARDTNLLDICLKTLPASSRAQIDWDEVARQTGLKDKKNARDAFRKLCLKRGWYEAAENGSGDGITATPVKTPSKPRASAKKSAKNAVDVGANIDNTPTKKAKIEKEEARAPIGATMGEFLDIDED